MRKSKRSGRKSRIKHLMILCGAAAIYALWRKSRQRTVQPVCAPGERLVIKDEENLSGVGLVMENMIGSYLDNPEKVRLFDKINFVIAIEPLEEPESAITMAFSDGCVVIEPGIAPDADAVMSCPYDVLMELPKMGVGPQTKRYLMTPKGKEVIGKFISGQIKIRGAIRRGPEMIKLTRFLEVPSDV